jgi:hypothetical protein
MTINVPPDKIPTAESVRSLLFPSAMAVSVDAQGMHIVSREAFFDIQSLAAGLNSLAMSRAQQQAAMSAGQMAGGPGAGQPGAGNFPGAPGAGAAGGARGGGGGTSASRPD